MTKKLLLYVAIASVFNLKIYAQNDSLIRGSIIDVVKTFRPVLSDAIKIPINPNPELPEVKQPTFDYTTPNFNLSVEPTVYTIKPLSLGTTLLPKIKGNYIKLGYGNFNMPLVEVYANTTRNKNRQAGVFYKHLSASGDNDYNSFSNNTIYGYTKEISGKNVYSLDAYYHRNRVNTYGFNNELLKPSADSTRNLYNLFDLKGGYTLMGKDENDLKVKLGADYYFYNSNHNIVENDINVTADINKKLLDVPFKLPIGIRFNSTNLNGLAYQRMFISVNPEVNLSDNDFYIKAGFNSTYFADSANSDKTAFHFFPKAEAGFFVVPKKLTVLAGLTGNLNPNTLRSLTTENPFLRNFQLINTINKFEVYGGIKGQLSNKSSFVVTSSSSKITNQLFYGYDSLTNAQFSLYDIGTGSLVKLSFGLDYMVTSKFLMALNGTLFNYKLNKLPQPYSRPGFEFKLNASYNMADKFLFRYDMLFMNQRIGLQQGIFTAQDVKINPFVDFNIGLDYRYNKNVSAFINFNNIANNRYQMWLNYPVYGFNILGGLTFTF